MKRSIFSKLFLAGALAVSASQAGAAALLTMDLQYVGSFDNDVNFNPIAPVVFDGSQPYNAANVHQFDVRFGLNGQDLTEDFWTVAFNLHLGPGLTALDFGGGKWNPSSGSFDSNGALAGGVQNHWQAGNGDLGFDSNDLLAINIEAAKTEANNRQYGEAVRPKTGTPDLLGSPTLLGTIFVTYNGTQNSQIVLDFITGDPWGTYINNSTGTGATSSRSATTAIGDGFQFTGINPVPEPSTLAALGLTGLTILRRRIAR